MAPVIAPTPVLDIARGIASLDEDIPRVFTVLGKTSIDELGWKRPDKSTLLIPMEGILNGDVQHYLLRLAFPAYRRWPPSALFVNPETLAYQYPADQHHLPMLTSPECYIHPSYAFPNARPGQLICCSATQEFYDMAHQVEPDQLWKEKNTFLTTIMAIRRALASSYGGRFPKL